MDAGPDDEPTFQQSLDSLDQHGPGHKIEEELATALGESVVDSLEPTDHPVGDQSQSDPTLTQNDNSNINPDVASIISEIMDHTERQDQTVAMGTQELSPVGEFPGARGFAFLKANSHLKIQSLPILDNLVSLILALSLVTNRSSYLA